MGVNGGNTGRKLPREIHAHGHIIGAQFPQHALLENRFLILNFINLAFSFSLILPEFSIFYVDNWPLKIINSSLLISHIIDQWVKSKDLVKMLN